MFSKNLLNIQKLLQLPYFSAENVADVLNIKIQSARVFCSRYVKKGLFIKLKNNFYVTGQKLGNTGTEELISIANMLQVPSYVSFMTALAFYEVTTQVQPNFVESCSLKRSVEYEAKSITFKYYRLKKKYYFDFARTGGLFIASKEKSFLDSVYLYSFGKYKPDIDSLDLNKLDMAKLKNLIKIYPEKTKKIVRKLCRI